MQNEERNGPGSDTDNRGKQPGEEWTFFLAILIVRKVVQGRARM